MGGLDRYLNRWIEQAGAGPEQWYSRHLQQLCSPPFSYSALDQEGRGKWLEKMLRYLNEIPADSEEKKINRLSASRTKTNARKVSPTNEQPLDSPITIIRGISPAVATRFARLGVETVRDMLYFFPRRHLDYSQRKPISELKVGAEQTIIATIWEARAVTLGNHRSTEAIVGDETGNIRVVWFNQPFLAKTLRTNNQVAISGKVSLFKGQKVFESPEWEFVESEELIHTGRLVPLYPLTQGLTPRLVRKLVKQALNGWCSQMPEFLPPEVRERCQLLELPQAIVRAHYPDDRLIQEEARRRLAFDELFLLQLGVLSQKQDWQEGQQSNPLKTEQQVLGSFLGSLPFTLTAAQQRVLQEILSDMARTKPMCRLLQGEVGSGKTVVATAALLIAIANRYQGALMAPTEILSEQHFHNITQLLSRAGHLERKEEFKSTFSSLLPHPFTIALLIGSISPGEKQKLQQDIKEGRIHLAIGTHALIQKGVEFQQLGLAVVDEQHRFGVMQRASLRQKGFNPHLLVMTATPIPRSLALTLYGDLDLSIIDQLPPGRQVVKTKWLAPEQREPAYKFVRRKVAEGQQAFIICPLIEESEAIEAKAAIAEHEHLSREVFPDLRLGLLHGRMSASEKEDIMRRFRAGELPILVSTPVVEVGIDVPNATVMLVEGADRFGLSQLHQFRGRVGRGEKQSYCLLLAESPSLEGRERLALIEQIHDGFRLAEEDLKLRGPGEFFGTRQSGLPELRLARLSDTILLELAREEAIRLLQQDAKLKRPEHRLLTKEMARRWGSGGEWS